MGFQDVVNENLRLAMLRCLEESSSFTMNDSMLQTYLGKIGHVHSRDKIRAELQWLADQCLVSLGGPEAIMVATLTERGLDVANARAKVPGIKRPSPRN